MSGKLRRNLRQSAAKTRNSNVQRLSKSRRNSEESRVGRNSETGGCVLYTEDIVRSSLKSEKNKKRASFYPNQVIEYKFIPEHLDNEKFLETYCTIKSERMAAKKAGNKLKDSTLKLSINGTFGMFGNRYSWLFDHKVRLQICTNGQLLLAMLIEKFFKVPTLSLIDVNT